MKKISILFLLVLFLTGCTTKVVDMKDKLITEKTTQYFLDEAIPDEDIKNIIKAGINATSAMNYQDWYFSVVTDKNLMDEFKEKMGRGMSSHAKEPQATEQEISKADLGDSPLAIVVSCGDKSSYSMYDAALASQNMIDYAILLGYGSKIVASPCKMIDENYKERLNIPDNMHTCAVILMGKAKDMKDVDVVSSASVRKDMSEVASFN